MGIIPILAEMLGFIIGFYLFYAIIAAIFKHEIGLIVSGIGMLCSILMTRNSYINFLSTIVTICILVVVPQLQINSKNNKKSNGLILNKTLKIFHFPFLIFH